MADYANIGRKNLHEIDGEAGVRVEEALNRVSPDLARYLIEYSFGEIYAREGLDNRTKELDCCGCPDCHGNCSAPAEGPHSCGASRRVHSGRDP